MNVRQKRALWLGIALFCGLGLYPPWVQLSAHSPPTFFGHAFLFREPAVVDCDYLFSEWSDHKQREERLREEGATGAWLGMMGSPYHLERFSCELIADGINSDRAEALAAAAAAGVPLYGFPSVPLTSHSAALDTTRLLVEWTLVLVVTIGALLTLRSRSVD